MKRPYRYRITVEPLAPADEALACPSAPLRFEAASHEEILGLVQRVRQRADFTADASAALTVGLKLLGEVMLQHREHPLFEEFRSHFGQFMKRLKGSAVVLPGSGEVPAERPESILGKCGCLVERLFDALRCE
jgi:hypothetical protein